MENALLISLSQQMALKRRMDVANNLANVNTAGFKVDSLQFEEFVAPVARVDSIPGASGRLSYVQDGLGVSRPKGRRARAVRQRPRRRHHRDGWFVVETPQGERYTRYGEFQLNAEGQFVTGAGYPVLGEGGPFTSPAPKPASRSPRTAASPPLRVARIACGLVQFERNAFLQKEGASLYARDEAPQTATQCLRQPGHGPPRRWSKCIKLRQTSIRRLAGTDARD